MYEYYYTNGIIEVDYCLVVILIRLKWIQFEEIKKLLSVSDIAKNKSLKDIVSSKEWVEFYNILKEGDLNKIYVNIIV